MTMTSWGLEFDQWSSIKMVILWLNFVVTSKVYHFWNLFWLWKIWILAVVMIEILTIWPWLCWDFGHGHGRRPSGQKIMVALPPPPSPGQPPNLYLCPIDSMSIWSKYIKEVDVIWKIKSSWSITDNVKLSDFLLCNRFAKLLLFLTAFAGSWHLPFRTHEPSGHTSVPEIIRYYRKVGEKLPKFGSLLNKQRR